MLFSEICLLYEKYKIKKLSPPVFKQGTRAYHSRVTTLIRLPLTMASLIEFGREMIRRNPIAVTGDPGIAYPCGSVCSSKTMFGKFAFTRSQHAQKRRDSLERFQCLLFLIIAVVGHFIISDGKKQANCFIPFYPSLHLAPAF